MLRDRVSCLTATTGTGTVTLGASAPGYRTFDAAFTVNVTVSYVIVENNAWETGTGVYNKAGNTMTRVLEASSTGALLALGGAAIVSVAFLAKEHVPDWPVMVVARGGSLDFQNIGAAFTTIAFNVAASVDSHGGWNSATNVYTVPQAGTYQVVGKLRLADGNRSGLSYGLGMDTANVDTAGFQWGIGVGNRQGLLNIRQMYLVAGDQLRLFAYVDGGGGTAPVNGAELIATRVR